LLLAAFTCVLALPVVEDTQGHKWILLFILPAGGLLQSIVT